MKEFKARVKVNGYGTDVAIKAKDHFEAKRLLEAQYGKQSLIVNPSERK